MNRQFSLAVVIFTLAALCITGCAGGPKPGATAAEISAEAPGLTYYVRADGNDANNGLSEDAPFRTLRKAVEAARQGKVKTITVLGTLNLESEGRNSLYPGFVFVIPDTGGIEITIRGGGGQGILSGAGAGSAVMRILGESRVRLEHLVIEGGDSEWSGAGLQIIDQARVTMGEGAVIRGNRSQSSGGGVVVAGTAAFTMENGEISTNMTQTQDASGGGVAVFETASFTMSGGAISGNTAQGGGGGGVAVFDTAVFMMRGGEISNNETPMSGGGVAMGDSATFTMKNGTISGNKSSMSGGGVAVDDSAIFTMENGEISANMTQAPSGGGGGVVVGGSAPFTMENGEISANTSQNHRGGVAVVGRRGCFEQRYPVVGRRRGGGWRRNLYDGERGYLR
jgi:hypothetical protein